MLVPTLAPMLVPVPLPAPVRYMRGALASTHAEQVELLDSLLRSVSHQTRRAMRRTMRTIWTRFVYARCFLDADDFLPAHSGRQLPRTFLSTPTLEKLGVATSRGAPDAFDTIMLELAKRKVMPLAT